MLTPLPWGASYTIYSGTPKSEHSKSKQCQLPNKNISQKFRIRTQICEPNEEPSLDCFICKYKKWSRLVHYYCVWYSANRDQCSAEIETKSAVRNRNLFGIQHSSILLRIQHIVKN